MHLLLFGMLLGMGAAIPIGPVNLEIIRRNLNDGTTYGIMLGVGACCADLTYLVILCLGMLALFQYPEVLRILSLVGSFVLAWFAYKIFRAKTPSMNAQSIRPSHVKYGIEGYLITLVNPYTILFWASVSSQLSIAAENKYSLFMAGLGVLLGTMGWALFLNLMLHFTRHHLGKQAIKWLNYSGAIILIGFSIAGIVRALFV